MESNPDLKKYLKKYLSRSEEVSIAKWRSIFREMKKYFNLFQSTAFFLKASWSSDDNRTESRAFSTGFFLGSALSEDWIFDITTGSEESKVKNVHEKNKMNDNTHEWIFRSSALGFISSKTSSRYSMFWNSWSTGWSVINSDTRNPW